VSSAARAVRAAFSSGLAVSTRRRVAHERGVS
jgi:hypothetical protein